MSQGGPTRQISSCFKEYCSCQTPTPESNSRTRQAATSILTLVESALNKAGQVKASLEKSRNGSRRTLIPATSVEHTKAIYSTMVSAKACLQNGAQVLTDINPELNTLLETGEGQARELQTTATTTAVFVPISKLKRLNKIAKIEMRADALLGTLATTCEQLGHFTKKDPTPAKEEVVREKKEERTLTEEERLIECLNPEYLEPFLEMARDRGWRIHDKSKRSSEEEFDDNDGFALSIELIQSIKQKPVQLLQEDQLIGIVEFPIVVVNKGSFPDRIIQTCVDPDIGYSIYLVFGAYVVVKNMMMMGIHESIMKVYDEDDPTGKPRLDTDKFAHLVPYLSSQEPIWAPTLEKLQPVQPIRPMGAHYYSPLMPRTVCDDWSGSLGDWAFLTQ